MIDIKPDICDALAAWITQKPNFTTEHASNIRRDIQRDKRDAEVLLTAIRANHSITAPQLQEAFKRAFRGRLRCRVNLAIHKRDRVILEYSGPLWVVEYRKAALAVMAFALWAEVASNITSQPPEMRYYFRQLFGSRLQRRWFSPLLGDAQ